MWVFHWLDFCLIFFWGKEGGKEHFLAVVQNYSGVKSGLLDVVGSQVDVVGSQFDQKPSYQRNEEIIYLVVSTHLKNISQNGNLLQIGVQIKNV